ncbi:MAG: MFS transporter, partial [Verrucomicrobia bacterium]|nr:MFS transporter [Verrucomicrobiota bacterium]
MNSNPEKLNLADVVERRWAPEWIVLATAAAAIFLSTLDSGVINVMLPALCDFFHISSKSASLAITVYMSVIASTIVLAGRLADRVGRPKILLIGFCVFGLASLFCGGANSGFELNASRAV